MTNEQETLRVLADADQAIKATEEAINAIVAPNFKAMQMLLAITVQLTEVRSQRTDATISRQLHLLPELEKQDLILDAKREVLEELTGEAQEQATKLIDKLERIKNTRDELRALIN